MTSFWLMALSIVITSSIGVFVTDAKVAGWYGGRYLSLHLGHALNGLTLKLMVFLVDKYWFSVVYDVPFEFYYVCGVVLSVLTTILNKNFREVYLPEYKC